MTSWPASARTITSMRPRLAMLRRCWREPTVRSLPVRIQVRGTRDGRSARVTVVWKNPVASGHSWRYSWSFCSRLRSFAEPPAGEQPSGWAAWWGAVAEEPSRNPAGGGWGEVEHALALGRDDGGDEHQPAHPSGAETGHDLRCAEPTHRVGGDDDLFEVRSFDLVDDAVHALLEGERAQIARRRSATGQIDGDQGQGGCARGQRGHGRGPTGGGGPASVDQHEPAAGRSLSRRWFGPFGTDRGHAAVFRCASRCGASVVMRTVRGSRHREAVTARPSQVLARAVNRTGGWIRQVG